MKKYYQEENYKKGVELFKNGAKQVYMSDYETGEIKVVWGLNVFKRTYKSTLEKGWGRVSEVGEWKREA